MTSNTDILQYLEADTEKFINAQNWFLDLKTDYRSYSLEIKYAIIFMANGLQDESNLTVQDNQRRLFIMDKAFIVMMILLNVHTKKEIEESIQENRKIITKFLDKAHVQMANESQMRNPC